MTNRIQRSIETGFTLLELLIALFLTGLIAVIISGALHLGNSSSIRVSALNEKIAGNFATQRFIRRTLSSIRTDHVNDTGELESFVPILGDDNHMLFLAEISRYQEQSEPVWFLLLIDPDNEAGPTCN